MAKGKQLIRLALFGQPVQSSLSPAIHRMFARQFGLDIEFQLIETGPDKFPARLQAFQLNGGTGCNITLPLKRDAWRLATDASGEVSLAQAANTLVYRPSSGWFAHNTDGSGLLTALTVNHAVKLEQQRILILGAGGATAGILGSLMGAKPAEVVIVNRNLERANSLASRFNSAGRVTVTSWDDLPAQGDFKLIINATSAGHQGEAPPLPASVFAAGGLCYDLNYFKASRPLKKYCEGMGQSYIDGLGMLVEQAAESFYIWTGQRPDTHDVIDACRKDAQLRE